MRGKTCVVTGATSGIGTEIARGLARRGAHVAVVARNPDKARATATALKEESPTRHDVDVFLADLSSLSAVRGVADQLHQRLDRIDVLVNNAGVAASKASTTPDGFDHMLASNYLGMFLLTNLVRDLLEVAAPSRVVVTASEAHRMARLDLDRLGKPWTYDSPVGAQVAYGTTKLCDLLFTLELARRLEGTGVTANCFCPGLVATNLVGESSTATRVAGVLARTPLVRRPAKGAEMGIKLAVDPALQGVTGRFFSSTPGAGLLPPVRARRDVDLQRRLWERTAELVGL